MAQLYILWSYGGLREEMCVCFLSVDVNLFALQHLVSTWQCSSALWLALCPCCCCLTGCLLTMKNTVIGLLSCPMCVCFAWPFFPVRVDHRDLPSPVSAEHCDWPFSNRAERCDWLSLLFSLFGFYPLWLFVCETGNYLTSWLSQLSHAVSFDSQLSVCDDLSLSVCLLRSQLKS